MNDRTNTSYLRPPAATALRIGARDIAPNEQLVLRSLIRLLDGSQGARFEFCDTITQCNVVFIPDDWNSRLPSSCVSVHVVADPARRPPKPRGLSVPAPLRMAAVVAALRAASELLNAPMLHASAAGPAALFAALGRHLMSRERRITCFQMQDGRSAVVDFVNEKAMTTMPIEQLLGGHYRLAEARRATPAEVTESAAWPALRLRELIWQIAHTLGGAGVDAGAMEGAYLLTRWPEAVVLSYPGYPRLCALLTARPMTLHEVCIASGIEPAVVRWFMQAALALGIATQGECLPASDTASPLSADAPHPLFMRLRDKLRLW